MDVKGLAISLGIGAAVGAVAVLAMPKNNAVRKAAAKAADKIEDAAWRMTGKMGQEFDM